MTGRSFVCGFVIYVLICLGCFCYGSVPFVMGEGRGVKVFALSLRCSGFRVPVGVRVSLAAPTLLFSTVSLVVLTCAGHFLSCTRLIHALGSRCHRGRSTIATTRVTGLHGHLCLAHTVRIANVKDLLLYIIDVFLVCVRFCLVSMCVFKLTLILLVVSLKVSIHRVCVSIGTLRLRLDSVSS